MKLIFKEYLDIFEKYSKDKYLTREERKERYKLLQEYEKRNYKDEVSIDEFQDFINLYIDKIDISSQFIGKFLEVIKNDINNGGTFALKFLIGDKEENNNYLKFFNLLYDEFGDRINLINKLLEKEPDYLPAIKQKYTILSNYIDFSIHEIPWGLLLDKPSLEKDAKAEALADLDDFLELSKKLGKDNKGYIEDCKIYYNAWFDFLDNKDKYKSYEEYLEKNNIEY
ncbi:hypothetical protein [Fusobacterium hwasookii]|uniref:Uncharacterized protein n=1 Tax=Fusobacterium hwasookii ChDC F206 TaxID=1307443 RepID=A0AAC8WJU9_9FUSO|nr:hypothetical protein [Fusobacterium hwasookii]ALQ35324.1 hypothetical protein RN92_05245 [Fusobacterium hwasookii ChDC F206]